MWAGLTRPFKRETLSPSMPFYGLAPRQERRVRKTWWIWVNPKPLKQRAPSPPNRNYGGRVGKGSPPWYPLRPKCRRRRTCPCSRKLLSDTPQKKTRSRRAADWPEHPIRRSSLPRQQLKPSRQPQAHPQPTVEELNRRRNGGWYVSEDGCHDEKHGN